MQIKGFSFQDLFEPRRLADLTELFSKEVRGGDPGLHARYMDYASGRRLDDAALSSLLVDLAPHVGGFLARAFGVEEEHAAMKARATRDAVIFRVKKDFFARRVLKKFPSPGPGPDEGGAIEKEGARIIEAITGRPWTGGELEIASAIDVLLAHERYAKVDLPAATREFLGITARALRENPGAGDLSLKKFLGSLAGSLEKFMALLYYRGGERTARWGLFLVPASFDFQHLVDSELSSDPVPGTRSGKGGHLRRRDGFDLTDVRFGIREVESEVDYCIFCHERVKDSCSKGFPADHGFRKNPLGYELKGCPLDQKISESHYLMEKGDALAALAVIMVDNPMVPGTGHRICNDCMKACIFQKQEPVNIPQIETRILTEVLDLPYGFEIYSLLTRWNPLNARRPHALPYNGMNILIVGLGPAGYTLAHYFLNEGFGVAAVDGLKIEPLPSSLTGKDSGEPLPVRDFDAVKKPLGERVLAGFGGVSEYGITVRWDKNFLTVLHLNLARRSHFRIYDGVRFGGTITLDDAWNYGFEHVCLASGAGKPTFISDEEQPSPWRQEGERLPDGAPADRGREKRTRWRTSRSASRRS
jgi:hypothetical protein